MVFIYLLRILLFRCLSNCINLKSFGFFPMFLPILIQLPSLHSFSLSPQKNNIKHTLYRIPVVYHYSICSTSPSSLKFQIVDEILQTQLNSFHYYVPLKRTLIFPTPPLRHSSFPVKIKSYDKSPFSSLFVKIIAVFHLFSTCVNAKLE